MGKTRHIQARMTQRGIREELVHLTMKFGFEHHDGKVVLNRKGAQELIAELEKIKRAAQKVFETGGLVVVAQGEALVTTYRLGK
jgi:hypothetical protein